jgi:hypothetical protein
MFKDAVGSTGSRIEDRSTARRMQNVAAQMNDLERKASDTSQKILALDRLIRTKDNQKQLEAKGLWSELAKMPAEDLADTLTGINIKSQEERMRIGEINRMLGVDETMLQAEESPELQDIMEQIEQARESGTYDEESFSVESQRSESRDRD